jgi:hypothetical protein
MRRHVLAVSHRVKRVCVDAERRLLAWALRLNVSCVHFSLQQDVLLPRLHQAHSERWYDGARRAGALFADVLQGSWQWAGSGTPSALCARSARWASSPTFSMSVACRKPLFLCGQVFLIRPSPGIIPSARPTTWRWPAARRCAARARSWWARARRCAWPTFCIIIGEAQGAHALAVWLTHSSCAGAGCARCAASRLQKTIRGTRGRECWRTPSACPILSAPSAACPSRKKPSSWTARPRTRHASCCCCFFFCLDCVRRTA